MNINGTTRTCGLIGNPVEHTLSPLIHNTLADLLGHNFVYVPFLVEQGMLKEAVKGANALHILGCNVTVPYKSDVMEYLDEIDELAKEIGAVNTLVETKNGYKGYNTDMPGLKAAMESEGIRIKDEKIIIFGAGGVARAVAMMAVREGVKEIVIVNRSLDKAENIKQELYDLYQAENIKIMKIEQCVQLEKHAYIGIQATSVGMYPKIEESIVLDKKIYEKLKVAYDLIFNPKETKFMKLAKENNIPAYNGLKMLLYQGVIAYELWNGIKIPEEVIHIVEKKLQKQKLILTGFMGSGKSSVGALLAEECGDSFIDMDQEIERKEGTTIGKIFEEKGEAYFRKLETEYLETLLLSNSNAIIATGGGVIGKEENRALLKQIGDIIYLKVSPKVVAKRLENDTTRPLLAGEKEISKIEALLGKREPLYESCADVIVSVDGKTPAEIVKEIRKAEKSRKR